MQCRNCNAPIPTGKRFCVGCGAPVAQAVAASFGHGIVQWMLQRLPLMVLSFLGSMVLHTYLLSWVNDGFAKRTWVAPYIHVDGNGASATVIWATLSALIWQFIIGSFRQGPIQTITSMIVAPLDRYRSLTGPGLGPALMGAGSAFLLSSFLPFNPQANLSAGIFFTIFGTSEYGRYAAQGLSRLWPTVKSAVFSDNRSDAAVNLRAAEMVIAGIGPALMIARFVPFPFFAGLLFITAGFLLWMNLERASAGTIGGMLIVASVAAAAHSLFSLFFPDPVEAHDFGRTEAGGDFRTWWNSPGREHALSNGGGPSTGAAVGPLAPPANTRDYGDRSNPWDPTKEEQQARWEKDRLVWDPSTSSWRPPKPGEIPRPPNAPEDGPYQRNNPRDKCPAECVGLWDEYSAAQHLVFGGEDAIAQATTAYQRSQDHLNKQLAKLALLTGWDLGSLAGGGLDAARGAGSGIRAGSHAGGPGIISAALTAARERLSRAMRRISELTGRLGELAADLARRTQAVNGLENIALQARFRASQLKNALDGLLRKAARIVEIENMVKAAAERVSNARAAISGIRREMDAIEARIRRLETEKPKWDAWSAASQRMDELNAEHLRLSAELESLDTGYAARKADLNRSVGRLVDEREALRAAGRLDDANGITRRMGEIDAELDAARVEFKRAEAYLGERMRLHEENYDRTRAEFENLSRRLDGSKDPLEIPTRQRQLDEKRAALEAAERELDDALKAEVDANRQLGPGGIGRLERNAAESAERLGKAKEELAESKTKVESLQNRIARLEAEKPKWDAWSQAIDRLDVIRQELHELRSELRRLADDRLKKIAELDKEFDRLADVRAGSDLGDARAAAARMDAIKEEIGVIKAEGVAQDAAINTRLSDKLVEEHFGDTEVSRLSSQLDNSADPREIPQRRRQLADAERNVEIADRAAADALIDHERASQLLNTTRAEMAALDNRIAGARRSVGDTKAEVSSLEARIQKLEAQRPIWDAIEGLKKRIAELEQEAMNLRVREYDLETGFNAKKAGLEAEKSRLAGELEQIRNSGAAQRVELLTEQIQDLEQQIVRTDAEAQAAKTEMAQRVQAKLTEKDAALADRRAIERTLDPADDPAQLPQRRAELDRKRAEVDSAQRNLDEALDAEGPIRQEYEQLRREVSEQEIAEHRRGIEVAERNAGETERRISEERTSMRDVQRQHDALGQEVDALQREADAAQRDIDAQSQGQSSAPAGHGGAPLDLSSKPDIVRWMERQMGDAAGTLGHFIQRNFGGQSPDEIAEVLMNCRNDLQTKLDTLNSLQSGYDQAHQRMRDLKPQLDACIERNRIYRPD